MRLHSLNDLYNLTIENPQSITKDEALQIIRELVWLQDFSKTDEGTLEGVLFTIQYILGIDDDDEPNLFTLDKNDTDML
jgi:hypothetical protein